MIGNYTKIFDLKFFQGRGELSIQSSRTSVSIINEVSSVEDVTRDGQRIVQSSQIDVSSVLITMKSNSDLHYHRCAFQFDEKSRRIVLQCYGTLSYVNRKRTLLIRY